MRLRKTNESINRSFDAAGESLDRIDSISYEVLDGEGNVIGNANVYTGNANLNISLQGFGGIADGEALLREVIGDVD